MINMSHCFGGHITYPLFTVIYFMIVNINLQKNQSSMSPYGYIYFIWDCLYSAFYTSIHSPRYQDLLQCTSIILEILLYFMLYTHWLNCFLLDYDQWKVKICWRNNDLFVKLNFAIVHLVGFNKTVYQTMIYDMIYLTAIG
jgi:hypothetical protein